MSKDFYFNKWKEALERLQKLVELDVHYQVIKAHDQKLSEAVHRLSSVLGQYILMYNEIIECVQQNLQVQKAVHISRIIQAIVSRILELKRQLEKLEGSEFQFIGRGLIEVLHTIWDIKMTAIPVEEGRPKEIQPKLEKVLAKAKEKKLAMERMEETEEESKILHDLCDEEEDKKHNVIHSKKDKVNALVEEKRKRTEYLTMIMAHEKTRQVTRAIKVSKLKREMWEKELTGRLQPIARYELRERSAEVIQTVFRAYFELKRERIKHCKRDELLGINICETQNIDKQRQYAEEMLQNRSKLHETYQKEWLTRYCDLKQRILENDKAKLIEEFGEQIREWFMEWFESVKFFHDIPKDGSAAIFRGEVPNPLDWHEENKALMLQAEANKKKSPQDLKFEKMEAKRQEKMLKREEHMKIKAEALLLKKMMKNPTMHPGFKYPQSKRTQHLQEVIDNYHKCWDMYDVWETMDVKEKYVHKVDVEDAIMEVMHEVLPEVDEIMWTELRQLKQALKEDYKNNEEPMPVNITKPIKGVKKKKKLHVNLSDRVAEITENLAVHGVIVEYPKTKIEDYIGDPNFGGEDLRAQIFPTFPFNFEIGAYWWEKCRNVCHGLQKILLVGPKSSGKTILVHTLASMNDAVLFELDPYKVQGGQQTAPFLKRLMLNVVTSARNVQPAVIHIKFIEKLYYTKVPLEEAEMNLPLIRSYLVQKLMKKIHKSDKITVIATCIEPWVAKSSTLLKQFPAVLLLPNTTYSLVIQMLKEWVVRYEVIPADFNVNSLAQVLQGYSFGYLKKALDEFMSADRIVKIAAFGLTEMEVYNYILEDETEIKIVSHSVRLLLSLVTTCIEPLFQQEYDKYLNWYSEKTASGRKEKQHLQEQRDFKAAVEKYAAKNKKKAKSAPSSTTGSHTGL